MFLTDFFSLRKIMIISFYLGFFFSKFFLAWKFKKSNKKFLIFKIFWLFMYVMNRNFLYKLTISTVPTGMYPLVHTHRYIPTGTHRYPPVPTSTHQYPPVPTSAILEHIILFGLIRANGWNFIREKGPLANKNPHQTVN